ncbi:MAG: serine/threonine-protein kinase [Polyangia bacterium]
MSDSRNGEGTDDAPAVAGPSVTPSQVGSAVTDGKAGLKRYELLDEVGQGGMAIVYRAHDTMLDREVAVKVLHPHLAGQAESRDRLEREAQAVAKLRHENILEIFDYSGRSSDESYIVTEFIHGTTLRQFTTAHALPYPELAELIVSEIARALEHAHKAGVIHRDIKPENVMIRSDGLIKLMDFGIAQMVDKERMTQTGQLMGSPAYMAPEHVEGGGIDVRTDVFSVGILLYQLATGQLPFRGRNPHEMLKRIADCVYAPPDSVNPRVGRRLTKVIARALAKNKADRYGDVGELRRDLLEDLTDAGLDDPRAELVAFFAAPAAFIGTLGPRMTDALTARGRKLLGDGRRAAALEAWRRALEITPTSQELLALVKGIERRQALGRSLVGATGLGCLALAAAVGIRAWPRPVVEVQPPALQPPPISTKAPSIRSAVPPVKFTPRIRIDRARIAPTIVPPAPIMPKRHFELVPTPKAVRVLVDGQPLGDYGPGLMAVDLDQKPHTITFDSPFCYPENILLDDKAESGRIVRRLKWRPGTLTVHTQPDSADIVVDGRLIARSGHPISMPMPPLSDGRRVVTIKVSAPDRASVEKEVELRANESETINVSLAGPPL